MHLRDPGLTYKEDIVSGSKAAARGGFTTILAMPNTKPVIDSADRVKYVQNKAKELSPIHVMQIGAITKGQSGEELADIEEMIEQGVPAISEDGKSVMNARLYKNAMGIAAKYDIPVFAHCEDRNIVGKGCVNEDEHSREMGLRESATQWRTSLRQGILSWQKRQEPSFICATAPPRRVSAW